MHDAKFGESASCLLIRLAKFDMIQMRVLHSTKVYAMLVFRMRKFLLSGDETSVQPEQASSKKINCLFASN